MVDRIDGSSSGYGVTMYDDAAQKRLNNPKCIGRYGFKVYSQNDEDGILQEIFSRIGTTNKIFIEFGV